MGAASFNQYQGGTHLGEAFKNARMMAEAEDGGRRGNVAAKDEVVPLVKEPVTLEAAYELADQYSEKGTQGVDDKWGPAGAIAVRGQERHIHVDLVEKAGGFATLEEAAKHALEVKGLLREGEGVRYGVQGSCERDRRGRVTKGQALVPVAGGTGPEQTGWLFFGVAAD
jgi:hypothetical protein